ncbi:endoplasmic reticulum metallopeptidase 1-like, partial [Ostrinia nubilalis]|uniref:endoplasmic reticulum metallopeptidase 1-like n=1 Tax=Ostrinia nubilalis TaxID=29057 RepID=UPI00308267A1
MVQEYIKENVVVPAPVTPRVLAAALAAALLALAGVALIDLALPEPLQRGAPPERFIAELAHEHLVNLTAIGPRVAGSYENEVAAVRVLVEALKDIARAASPHNHVEIDLHRASGAFSLSFFDGMNNVYRDVQSVVARVRGAGGAPGAALLLNCHFDTVPDSPGASDDGAGCAVLLETLRALAAAPRPLRHSAVFLFNGAEENIMQASHAFITQHRWAKSVRAFINIEACGAGGREVLFQAGPHDPWIVEVYAGAVPHPFASSLAQELFESGLIPADTDFRIFRDFGRLSGVDLAWSANGYVYHTRLDTAERVPRAALQRTGDNVLALAHGLLASESLESEVDRMSRQPVFFDVLGWVVVSARAPLALALAAGALALLLLRLRLAAGAARAQRAAARADGTLVAVYVRARDWWALVARCCGRALLAAAGGAGAAVAVAAALHAAGARLSCYSRGWLLAPLYALPALATAAYLANRSGGRAAWERGWWGARAAGDAGAALWAALLLLCALLRLRSGFVPFMWVLLPTLADLAATLLRAGGRARACWWAAGAALPLLQTCYLALGSLAMFVPIMGRAGSSPVPPDVALATIVSTLVLAACSWMFPFVVAARGVKKMAAGMWAVTALTAALVLLTPLGAPYSAERPQRFMIFHVTRTEHGAGGPRTDHLYWMPDLDPNTPHTVDDVVPEMRAARPTPAADCERHPYCGAAYCLPVLALVPRAHWLPAPAPPPARPYARTELHATRVRLAPELHELRLNITGPSHVVVIVSPAAGGRVVWSSALAPLREAAPWGARRTYFLALHTARAPRERPWS